MMRICLNLTSKNKNKHKKIAHHGRLLIKLFEWSNCIIQNQQYQGVERLENDDNREMNMDSLFPAIDTDKTIKNCKHFLAVTFPAMVRTSGKSIIDLKSPTVDDMPRSQSTDNGIEKRIYQRLYAEQVVKRTIEAISHCSETSKQVLSYLYLDEYTDTMCYMSIGYSRSHYFDHVKPAALLEFADAYLLDDLHVLK